MITLRPLEPNEGRKENKKYGCFMPIQFDQTPIGSHDTLYEIIDTPQPERYWSDVVDKIHDQINRMGEFYFTKDDIRYRNRITEILQQADKRVPLKRTRQMYLNIYRSGCPEIFDNKVSADLAGNARKRICRKEIEIEYTEGEGLNDDK